METDEKRRDENSRDSASRSGSMDSTNTTKPIETFNGLMDIDEDKGRSGHDVQSGRVHKGGRKLVCSISLSNNYVLTLKTDLCYFRGAEGT
jgi:hypothetical protein